MLADGSTRGLDRLQRTADVGRPLQPEAEVDDATGVAGRLGPPLENEHVARRGRLRLNEVGLLVDRNDAQDSVVEREPRRTRTLS